MVFEVVFRVLFAGPIRSMSGEVVSSSKSRTIIVLLLIFSSVLFGIYPDFEAFTV